jgi:outer membrane protein
VLGEAQRISWEAFIRPYEARPVPPVNFQNSERIFDLMRAGQLYLSLADAIALALENNLDIEVERYLPRIAQTDIGRAKGGGLLRGLEPAGKRAASRNRRTERPAAHDSHRQLDTGAAPVNTNLSDVALITRTAERSIGAGATPLSTGPAIPQYDPSLSGQFNWAHQSTPEFDPLITGSSNWLVSNNLNGNVGWTQGFSPGTQLKHDVRQYAINL